MEKLEKNALHKQSVLFLCFIDDYLNWDAPNHSIHGFS